MGEIDQYTFSFKEIAEALVKQQGLHEGLWAIRVEYGLTAANIGTVEGSKDATPAAIVPIIKLGIQRGSEDNNLTVDAAKVNPKPTSTSKRIKSK